MMVLIMILAMIVLTGCSEDTFIFNDKSTPDTYYLDLRSNVTHKRGIGTVNQILNQSGATENLTYIEEVVE